MEGAGALQHRRRRLRQAPARRSRRWSGSATTAPAASSTGASSRTSPTRPRTCCASTGSSRGDRVAVVLPPTPETAAIFFGTWKLGAILLSMSVLYGDDGIRHRLEDSTPKVLVTDAANAERFDAVAGRRDARPRRRAARRPPHRPRSARTPRPTTRRSSTTPRGPPGMAKGIVHAHRYILAHEEFVYCHDVRDGERFHGMGEWAWAAGISPLLGPWRLGAVQYVLQREAGFVPADQLDFLSRHGVTNVFTTPTAMRAMMAIDGRRRALPAGVPDRLLGRRAAQPRGDPLVPRAVRGHGARLLRAHRVLSAVRELPVHGGARGLDGPDDAGLGRADPRRGREPGRAGRARRDLPARALQPALPARLLEPARGDRGDLRRRLVPHQGRGDHGRGRLRLVRGPRRRRDHRRRLPDRAVRGRVGLHRAPGGARGGRGRLARRGQGQRGQGVHRPRRGPRALRRARRRRSRASSASASAPTPTRARSSSSTSCRRP